jgi:hypothetical protein
MEFILSKLPGKIIKIDDDLKKIIDEIKILFTENEKYIDKSNLDSKIDLYDWGITKFKNIDQPENFDLFSKIYYNFVFPQKENDYRDLYKKIIHLFSKDASPELIFSILEKLNTFLNLLYQKFR